MLYCCSNCKCDIETSLEDEVFECYDSVCLSLDNKFCSEKCRDEHVIFKCNSTNLSTLQRINLYFFKKIIKKQFTN